MILPTQASTLWLWAGREASEALRTRDLSVILRTYRRLTKTNQDQLATILGYDKTYISMFENRRRVITDVGTLRHIANTLAVPVHALGVTDTEDATFTAMLQFAGSVLSLAETARQSGRAVEAVNELWPLVARLEARAAEGLIERDSLAVLGRARLSLGLALGTVLPDEALATAAKWTRRALVVAEQLDDDRFLVRALTMHGNELRKAGRTGAAIEWASRGLALARDAEARASACAVLARAAGEAGRPDLFDTAIEGYRRNLGETDGTGMLSNPFTFSEILLRGLVATGRARQAVRMLHHRPNPTGAPQWTVIEQITVGEVLLADEECSGAESVLLAALVGAETYRLPHQAQRAVRTARRHSIESVMQGGRALLDRLDARHAGGSLRLGRLGPA
jgi:transcriptional regulator with XRE-family HTH domain